MTSSETTSYCHNLQQRLAESGAQALQNDASAQEHLVECNNCFPFLEALEQLDPLLRDLPAHDPGDELTMRVLERVSQSGFALAEDQDLQFETLTDSKWSQLETAREVLSRLLTLPWRYLVWVKDGFKSDFSSRKRRAVFAICSTVFVAMFAMRSVVSLFFGSDYVDFEAGGDFGASSEQTIQSVGSNMGAGGYQDNSRRSSSEPLRQRPAEGKVGDSMAENSPFSASGQYNESEPESSMDLDGAQLAAVDKLNSPKKKDSNIVLSDSFSNKQRRGGADILYNDLLARSEKPSPAAPVTRGQTFAGSELVGNKRLADQKSTISQPQILAKVASKEKQERREFAQSIDEMLPMEELAEADGEEDALLRNNTNPNHNYMAAGGVGLVKASRALEVLGSYRESQVPQPAQGRRDLATDSESLAPADDSPAIPSPLEEFRAERLRTEGHSFKEAAGYWANTYLPGDPTVRKLRTALLNQDLSALQRFSSSAVTLHENSKQTTQPFDSPENSALAVYLHADQKAIDGKTRLLLQVGLKGTERKSGHRGAMNIAVVLDARGEMSAETTAKLQELLLALNAAKDIGDRFSLFIAGQSEQLVLSPENFKHGPITIEMRKLADQTQPRIAAANLWPTVEQAIASASDSDDPTSPLGSSMVLVITAAQIGQELAQLTTLAHQSAVAGIPLSTIGVGESINQVELDQLALSGQGNRRLFNDGVEAKKIIDQELLAVSQVVARAVRLRIRLAAGVKLIDVIGSYRLDAVHSERVRQAEQSIDRRLSRNLGIEADRGEDEEGIQIVIPAYYSGDEHVIMLDVVTDAPGPLADVTARYKDLVYLRNGVSRANLSLSRENYKKSRWGGPLERNVVKNLMAMELAQSLAKASGELAQQNTVLAIASLEHHRKLLRELQLETSGFDRDQDLALDLAMIENYLVMLRSSAPNQPALRDCLINSLDYAGKLKINPEPNSNQENELRH